MRKFLLPVAVVATLGFASCGGIDVEKAGDEFCACKDSEDPDKCRNEWAEKYKGAKGSQEDGEKLGKKMAECDPAAALETLQKMQ